jgi:clan AA aspartic protease
MGDPVQELFARRFFMGLIHVTVTLRASEKSRKKYEADFLVDTGATDSMAPASMLQRAGIRRRGRMAYELADGSTAEYDFGLAEIEFMGELTSGRVVFGPENGAPLLGVTALESVGIVVEPATQRLKRLPAIPLKRAAKSSPAETGNRGLTASERRSRP